MSRAELKLGELAERLGARLDGDPELRIQAVRGLDEAGPLDLSFLANPRYRDQLATTRAGAVLLRHEDATSRPAGCAALLTEDPYAAFARALQLFHPDAAPGGWGRHPAAVVSPEARVHEETWLGPGVVVEAGAEIAAGCRLEGLIWVGRDARLGEGCRIHSGAQIRERCVLGNRVVLQSGVVVGSDGFGFAPVAGGSVKVPQTGRVLIEDDVEVGANTCLDRGTLGDTVVRRGARLDNLIQVAHNVEIGEGTLMAAQCGVAGSTHIGARCLIGGGAHFAGHISVGDQVQLGGNSGVTGTIPGGRTYAGFPARPHREFLAQQAALARLPELLKTVRDLEKRLAEAERRLQERESVPQEGKTPPA
jgi:UDP-3-O-[3-hydroxymyristoyl] glucosamine N-acyltransferase